MAFTAAQLAALDAAIASGELMVQYDGKRVEYRSMDDLLKARAFVAAQLEAQANPAPINRGPATLAVFGRDE
jgi:roadblock/LC7 domain-containing protein